MDQISSSISLPDLFSQCEENSYREIEILGEPVFDVYDDEHVFYVNDEEVSVTSYGDLHQQIDNEQPCPFYQREEDLYYEKDIYPELVFDIYDDEPIHALDDENLPVKRDGFSSGVPASYVGVYEDLAAAIQNKDGSNYIGIQRAANNNIYMDWGDQPTNCILSKREDHRQVKAEPPDPNQSTNTFDNNEEGVNVVTSKSHLSQGTLGKEDPINCLSCCNFVFGTSFFTSSVATPNQSRQYVICFMMGFIVQPQESTYSSNSVLFFSHGVDVLRYERNGLVMEWFHQRLRPKSCLCWHFLKMFTGFSYDVIIFRAFTVVSNDRYHFHDFFHCGNLFVAKWNYMFEVTWNYLRGSVAPYDGGSRKLFKVKFLQLHEVDCLVSLVPLLESPLDALLSFIFAVMESNFLFTSSEATEEKSRKRELHDLSLQCFMRKGILHDIASDGLLAPLSFWKSRSCIFSSSKEPNAGLMRILVGVIVQPQENTYYTNSVFVLSQDSAFIRYVRHRLVSEWFQPRLRPHNYIFWHFQKMVMNFSDDVILFGVLTELSHHLHHQLIDSCHCEGLFVDQWNDMVKVRWNYLMGSVVRYLDGSRKLCKANCDLDGHYIVLQSEPELLVTPLRGCGVGPPQEDSESQYVVSDFLLVPIYMFRIQGGIFSTLEEHDAPLFKVQRQMICTARWEDNLWYGKASNIEKLLKTTKHKMVLIFCSKSKLHLYYQCTSLLITCHNVLVRPYLPKSQLPLLISETMSDYDGFLHVRCGQNEMLLVTCQTCENLWLHMGSFLVFHPHDQKSVIGLFRKVFIFGALISHHKQVLVLFYVDTFSPPKQQSMLGVDSMVFLRFFVSSVRASRDYFWSVSLTVVDCSQGSHCVVGCFRHGFGVLIHLFNEIGKREILWPPWVAKLHCGELRWETRDVRSPQLSFNYTLTKSFCLSDVVCSESKLFWPPFHLYFLCYPSLLSPPSRIQLRLLVGLVSEDIYYWRDTQYKQRVWFLPHTRPLGHRLHENLIVLSPEFIEVRLGKARSSTCIGSVPRQGVSQLGYFGTLCTSHSGVSLFLHPPWLLMASLSCILVPVSCPFLVSLLPYGAFKGKYSSACVSTCVIFLMKSHNFLFGRKTFETLGGESSLAWESHQLLCDQFKDNTLVFARLLGQRPRFEDESFSHPERLMQRMNLLWAMGWIQKTRYID